MVLLRRRRQRDDRLLVAAALATFSAYPSDDVGSLGGDAFARRDW